MKRWLVVLVLLAGCGGGSKAAPTTTAPTSTTLTDEAPQAAVDACHTLVKRQLKSPGSAIFDKDAPHYSARFGGSESFRIKGTVDSENGFGALLRSDYDCSATPTDGVYSASLVSLNPE